MAAAGTGKETNKNEPATEASYWMGSIPLLSVLGIGPINYALISSNPAHD